MSWYWFLGDFYQPLNPSGIHGRMGASYGKYNSEFDLLAGFVVLMRCRLVLPWG